MFQSNHNTLSIITVHYATRNNTSFLLGKRNLKYLRAFIPMVLGDRGRRRDCIIWFATIYCCLNMVNNSKQIFSFWYSLQVLLKFTRNVSTCKNSRWIILFTVRNGYYLNFTNQIYQQILAMQWNSPAALLWSFLTKGYSELRLHLVVALKDDTELPELTLPISCIQEYFCLIYFSAFLSPTSISRYSPPVFSVSFYFLFIGCISNVLALYKYMVSI